MAHMSAIEWKYAWNLRVYRIHPIFFRSAESAAHARASIRRRRRRREDRSVGRWPSDSFPRVGRSKSPSDGNVRRWVDLGGRSGLSASRKRVDLSKRPGSRFGLLVRRAAVLARGT
jgi:hypothetical protein